METMTFETAAASDGLYCAFPYGFKDSSDVWLGTGWIDKIVVSPGGTAPSDKITIKVYDAFDYSSGRALVNATTLARFCVRPGGTITGTRGDTNPEAHVATLSLTNLRPKAQVTFKATSVDVLFPMTLVVDAHFPCGMIVTATTESGESGTYFVTVHYMPQVSGATRKGWATNNRAPAGLL